MGAVHMDAIALQYFRQQHSNMVHYEPMTTHCKDYSLWLHHMMCLTSLLVLESE